MNVFVSFEWSEDVDMFIPIGVSTTLDKAVARLKHIKLDESGERNAVIEEWSVDSKEDEPVARYDRDGSPISESYVDSLLADKE